MTARRPRLKSCRPSAPLPTWACAFSWAIANGCFQIGLFSKLGYGVFAALACLARAPDVAVAGFGAVGGDAEDDDGTHGRSAHATLQCSGKDLTVNNGLICGGT